MKLLDNKYLTNLECYEIDNCLMDRLYINKNLKVVTRHKVEFASEFMKDNFLNHYSDIYYKRTIVINHELDEIELEDLRTFININTRLRLIKILRFTEKTIYAIIDLLKEYKSDTIRFALLRTLYRSDINITDDLFPESEKHLYRFYQIFKKVAEKPVTGQEETTAKYTAQIEQDFIQTMDDDFNTADGVSAVFELKIFIGMAYLILT